MDHESDPQLRRTVYHLRRRYANYTWRVAFWVVLLSFFVVLIATSGSLVGLAIGGTAIVVFSRPLRDVWRARIKVGEQLAELDAPPARVEWGPLLVTIVASTSSSVLAAVINTLIDI